MIYQLVSGFSFLIRAWLCYHTIDNIPILKNPIANNMLLEIISLYTILMVISRLEVSIVYKKGSAPTLGAILYFFIYLINLGIMYIVMSGLTAVGILPI